ncbi:MAG TPA: phosphopantetheine-binding protein [Nevskiaceae bacterium]|nr:phosphopantetheine-binding protein [Nevskiaceae bacterium]
MSAQSAAELEMAELLVKALNLEAVKPADIAPDAPLFEHENGGLGLDSIDALEISLAVQQQYGVELGSESSAASADARAIFRSLRTITDYVAPRRLR